MVVGADKVAVMGGGEVGAGDVLEGLESSLAAKDFLNVSHNSVMYSSLSLGIGPVAWRGREQKTEVRYHHMRDFSGSLS